MLDSPLKKKFLSALVRPEIATCILLVIALFAGLWLSPFFADFRFIMDSTSYYIEYGIIALIMTFLIIGGQMDLSVGSQIAMSSCVAALLFHKGLPFAVTLVIGAATGALCGLLNGFIVTRFKITPMIATIGTMSVYRGIAQALLGDGSLSNFPLWFRNINYKYAGGTAFPVLLLVFLALGLIMAVILIYSLYGGRIFHVGGNEMAARFSGIAVNKIKISLFVLSGIFSSSAGLLMMSRLTVARYDMARGGELDVITMVLLGGTSIEGGRGSVIGTIIAFFLVVFLRTGMAVANIKAEIQLIAMGVLLIASILLTNVISKWQDRINVRIKK
jgi:rhamnose transport system permease protein